MYWNLLSILYLSFLVYDVLNLQGDDKDFFKFKVGFKEVSTSLFTNQLLFVIDVKMRNILQH